jgi:hypothetical protein
VYQANQPNGGDAWVPGKEARRRNRRRDPHQFLNRFCPGLDKTGGRFFRQRHRATTSERLSRVLRFMRASGGRVRVVSTRDGLPLRRDAGFSQGSLMGRAGIEPAKNAILRGCSALTYRLIPTF